LKELSIRGCFLVDQIKDAVAVQKKKLQIDYNFEMFCVFLKVTESRTWEIKLAVKSNQMKMFGVGPSLWFQFISGP